MNKSGVTSFAYYYYGSIGGDSYNYQVVTAEDGSLEFKCEFMEYYAYGEMSCPIDPSVLDELNAIYTEQSINKWNGFDKVAKDVLDGDGFSLRIGFADGDVLRASGSNSYPKGYSEFCHAIDALFKPYVDELLEQGRQGIIAEGVKGDIDFFMINFHQQGASGRDEYSFFVLHQADREDNFDADIDSESGDFFPEGYEQHFYCPVPDEDVPWTELKALVEKYDLMQWYGWDKAAEDYNNCEWFQIDIGFEEGQISAYGTEHPANYDAFRAEFLELMKGVVDGLE